MRFLLLLSLLLSCATAAEAADLTVTVRNVQSTQGKVRVALYNATAGFPDQLCWWCQMRPAQVGSVNVVFVGLPPGTYAVSVFHDMDNNGKLNTNFAGVPNEPYGFSRGARGLFGPPSFVTSSFTVGTQSLTEEIELK